MRSVASNVRDYSLSCFYSSLLSNVEWICFKKYLFLTVPSNQLDPEHSCPFLAFWNIPEWIGRRTADASVRIPRRPVHILLENGKRTFWKLMSQARPTPHVTGLAKALCFLRLHLSRLFYLSVQLVCISCGERRTMIFSR